ncbi:hypothetical protein [Deinococcus yavapaiensis]|uniref:Uncharacterized protein n=1 Tax=Deinococcus yavapaiensis KR-236 TaxID=694435 RepID=A0A318S1E7_9DEIO|nr:hypothetical protein [Deinococcus yavapaiensis]PYE51056.1 hypothetical protein DES52_116123 [Deinococcus yavapaiensis KR-236]
MRRIPLIVILALSLSACTQFKPPQYVDAPSVSHLSHTFTWVLEER